MDGLMEEERGMEGSSLRRSWHQMVRQKEEGLLAGTTAPIGPSEMQV